MATMFPASLSAALRSNPDFSAEVTVFDWLQDRLAGRFHVFHAVRWISPRSDEGPKQGEADFVVVHPDRGFLVLEVKGGGISFSQQDGEWRSTDRSGRVNIIKDPIAQARRNRAALIEKLHSHPKWGRCWVHCGYAVAFPHCDYCVDLTRRADLEREIVLFEQDLESIEVWIDRAFQFWARDDCRGLPLSRRQMELVEAVLCPAIAIRRSMAADLREAEEALLQLTDEQIRPLSIMREQKRVAVGGGAGTGKTLLALEKSRQLSEEGFRVLLTCFNRALAAELRSATVEWSKRPVVLTFHELCEQLAMDAGILKSTPEYPTPEYWTTELPDMLLEALDALPERRFNAVVVDEGQDLRDSWWTPLQYVLESPNDDLLYVFHDENQVVFGQKSSIPKDLVRLSLTENWRNTSEVFAVVKPLCPDPDYRGRGPQGLGVEYHEIDRPQAMQGELSRVLHRLIHERKLKLADLAVITGRSMLPRANSPSELRDLPKVGQFRLSHPWPGSEGAVLVESVRRFKGLEKPVIVLVEFEGLLDHEDLLYVAASRARSLLVIIGTAEVRRRFQP